MKNQIIIPSGTNVWPHELRTAKVLVEYGHNVRFVRKSEKFRDHSADAFIDGELWEFKAPKGANLKVVGKNLRRGARQCDKIIFDNRRIKNVPDTALIREVKTQFQHIKALKKVKIITRHRIIVDISK